MVSLCADQINIPDHLFFSLVGVTRERFSKSGDWAKAAPQAGIGAPFASGRWTEGLEVATAVGATGCWKDEKEKLTRRRRLSKSPWVSVAADLQAHVCGCCFVFCNKLLGVHEAAGSREPAPAGGLAASGGRRGASFREGAARAARRTASFHLSRTDSHVTLRSPAGPKEDMSNSYFWKIALTVA